jgi:hypothetical protein
MSIEASGENAPGKRSSFPERNPARNERRFSPADLLEVSIFNAKAQRRKA